MEIHEAIRKVNQILDQERVSPTITYKPRIEEFQGKGPVRSGTEMLLTIFSPKALENIRSQRPREVLENPRMWAFESTNYNLLLALLSQIPGNSRQVLTTAAIQRLVTSPGCGKGSAAAQPSWNGFVSELPLVAEFCLRNGAKDTFFRALGEAKPILGHAVLLRHVEDMIALDFRVLAEPDYESLDTAIAAFSSTAQGLLAAYESKRIKFGDSVYLCREIMASAKGITEECRKARYLYLKGELTEGLNLEVNQDKAEVENYLKRQGFSDELIHCLNHADQLYRAASSGFDFKSTMGHLRSFLEKLHSEQMARLKSRASISGTMKWGEGVEELHKQGLLTKAEKMYAVALYSLLSDEGVHPVIAEKEYARLARNVVIEYALLFLHKSEQLGTGSH